jgi:hypothetical protein
MQIELYVEGTTDQLRGFVDGLQAALGADADVLPWLGAADPEDQPKSTTVYVDVHDAADEAEAIERVQPAIRLADPEMTIVKGGTSAIRTLLPKQPPDSSS